MTHRVRWYAPQPNEQKFVQVDEGNGWVSYKQSVNYEADFEYPSGFRTFQNCLKKGYEIEPSVIVLLLRYKLGDTDKVSGIIAKMFNMRFPEAEQVVQEARENGQCAVFRGTPEQAKYYVKLSDNHCASSPQDEWYWLAIKN